MKVINFVKSGWRKNTTLAEIGQDLSDEGFNALLTYAYQKVASRNGKNLGENFQDEVNKFMQWLQANPEPATKEAAK